jgi:hypothetical protein
LVSSGDSQKARHESSSQEWRGKGLTRTSQEQLQVECRSQKETGRSQKGNNHRKTQKGSHQKGKIHVKIFPGEMVCGFLKTDSNASVLTTSALCFSRGQRNNVVDDCPPKGMYILK